MNLGKTPNDSYEQLLTLKINLLKRMTRKTRHRSFFSGWFALGWTKLTITLFEVACLSMFVKMCVFICKKLWWKVDFQIETLWHSKIIRFAEQSTRIYLRYLSYLYIRAVVCSTRPKTAWTSNCCVLICIYYSTVDSL